MAFKMRSTPYKQFAGSDYEKIEGKVEDLIAGDEESAAADFRESGKSSIGNLAVQKEMHIKPSSSEIQKAELEKKIKQMKKSDDERIRLGNLPNKF